MGTRNPVSRRTAKESCSPGETSSCSSPCVALQYCSRPAPIGPSLPLPLHGMWYELRLTVRRGEWGGKSKRIERPNLDKGDVDSDAAARRPIGCRWTFLSNLSFSGTVPATTAAVLLFRSFVGKTARCQGGCCGKFVGIKMCSKCEGAGG